MTDDSAARHQQVMDAFSPEDQQWAQRALVLSVGKHEVKVPVVHSRLKAVARQAADDGRRVEDVAGSPESWAESLARDVPVSSRNVRWPIVLNPRKKARVVLAAGLLVALGMCFAGFVRNAGQCSVAGMATPAVAMALTAAGGVAACRVFTHVRRPWGPLFTAGLGLASLLAILYFGVTTHIERLGGTAPVSVGWCGFAWAVVCVILLVLASRLPSAPVHDWDNDVDWQKDTVSTLVMGCGVNPPLAKDIAAQAVSSSDGRPLVQQFGTPLEFAHTASHGYRREVSELLQSAMLTVALPAVAITTATEVIDNPTRLEGYFVCSAAIVGTVWLILDKDRKFLRENAPRRLADGDGA